jgi:transcriptional regulator with XRE-family HTH domain
MTPETLRARRQALGLSQQALHDAIRAAMDEAPTPHGRSIISRWESGRVPVPSWMRVILTNIEEKGDT